MKDHRVLREQLGAYALGHLPRAARASVGAHLDGCASCRAELAEIAPLVDDLAGVDVERVSSRVSPPPELGERIRAAVAAEQPLVERRRRPVGRSLLTAAAAVVVLATGVGLGAAVTQEPSAPVEQVSFEPLGGGPTVESAGLVAHTWGVEVKLVGSGFRAGEVYRAAVRRADGSFVPAGQFLGTGERSLTCNLQSALLRPDATGFVVQDAGGRTVLQADL